MAQELTAPVDFAVTYKINKSKIKKKLRQMR